MYPLETTFFQIFLKGGPLMWVILLCSVIACAIAVERGVYYFSSLEDVGKLRRDLFNLLKRGDAEAALRSCDRVGSLAGQIFRAGLLRSGDGRGEIVRAMECVAQDQVQDLEKMASSTLRDREHFTVIGFPGDRIGTGLFGSRDTVQRCAGDTGFFRSFFRWDLAVTSNDHRRPLRGGLCGLGA